MNALSNHEQTTLDRVRLRARVGDAVSTLDASVLLGVLDRTQDAQASAQRVSGAWSARALLDAMSD